MMFLGFSWCAASCQLHKYLFAEVETSENWDDNCGSHGEMLDNCLWSLESSYIAALRSPKPLPPHCWPNHSNCPPPHHGQADPLLHPLVGAGGNQRPSQPTASRWRKLIYPEKKQLSGEKQLSNQDKLAYPAGHRYNRCIISNYLEKLDNCCYIH